MDESNNSLGGEHAAFSAFGFAEELLSGLESVGFTSPTPIQVQAIPLILKQRDLIACAQTGTGKTAAFLLPIIDEIIKKPQKGIDTLIIVPTRELAVQIDQVLEGLSYFTHISSIAVYGGGDGLTWEQQKMALSKGAEIVVATPGRLLALIQEKKSLFVNLRHLVLDEADRMLDMGFYDDIIKIIKMLPEKKQTMLFSATMAPKIRKLAEKILTNPHTLSLAISKPADKIEQQRYLVHENDKLALVSKLLEKYPEETFILFGSTKEKVRQFYQLISKKYPDVACIHSDLDQTERESTINKFKNHQIRVLIGTDIISRGIDVDDIGVVINIDVPPDPEDYIHRIGRTARADKSGLAITLITKEDYNKWQRIERLLGKSVTLGELSSQWNIRTWMESEITVPTSRHKIKKKNRKNKYRIKS